jgi:uncharacterized protein
MEVTLFVDHQCNLRCTYCYNGEKFSRAMSTSTMRKAIDLAMQASYLPFLDVSFFGGEPLLQRQLIKDTMAYVDQKLDEQPERHTKVRYIMNTNATLIDDDALALMGPPHDYAVFVSIDGPKDVHDQYRVYDGGLGSYDAVLAGLAKLRDANIPFEIVSVVNTDTAANLGETVATLSRLGATKLMLSANFRDDWTDDALDRLREGLSAAGRVWADLFRQGETFILEPLHGKILTHLKGGIPCPSRCMILGTEFTVTPAGRIYPCAQMVGEDKNTQFTIGDVDTGLVAERMTKLRDAKNEVEQTCATCEIRDRCQSHCGCRHIALTGKLGEITGTLCEIEAAFIDAADDVAEELYEEKCEAFIDFYYNRSWVPSAGGVLTKLRTARDV